MRKIVLKTLNTEPNVQGRVLVNLTKEWPDEAASFFSNHQKLVVIDRKTAYVGGMDVSYGRWDTDEYSIVADADTRHGLNRYNPCVPHIGEMSLDDCVDPLHMSGPVDCISNNDEKELNKIRQGAWQIQTNVTLPTDLASERETDRTTLDPATQPRMPWQDVHVQIKGPAARNVARNFALRWNIDVNDNERLEVPELEATCTSTSQTSTVQVLRSAPLGQLALEYKHLDNAQQASIGKPQRAQNDILEGMRNLIAAAEKFIYIENQFFISEFGEAVPQQNEALSGPSKKAIDAYGKLKVKATRLVFDDSRAPVQNDIAKKIAERIGKAIQTSQEFHVYITLPVHPEGMLNDGPVVSQQHLILQSLINGGNSLVKRVKDSLKANKKSEDDWSQYLTFLNLRNWGIVGPENRVITEQIYVHSKMMIVDDRYALLGSANINDRSLLGGRDAEIAVMMADTRTSSAFARKLRIHIWSKLLGLNLPGMTLTQGGVGAGAEELRSVMENPASPECWKAVQKRAQENTKIYEDVFDWIPRNQKKGTDEPASLWPHWYYDNPSTRTGGHQEDLMPFEEAFWQCSQANDPERLQEVRGFICAMPLGWTKRENNNWGYHSALLSATEPDEPGVETV